jgi:very-short-patch-repair endonuclease
VKLTNFPQLVDEWHSDNPPVEQFSHSSNKKVTWVCNKRHEWMASINSRTRGCGCPYCSGRRVTPENSLPIKLPELVSEWHPDNPPIEQFSYSSNKKVKWKCLKAHEWVDSINHRSSGRGCPYCSGHRATIDTSLINTPLMLEWSSRNLINPVFVCTKSGKKYWWICGKGHEWLATPAHRTYGTGCPYCTGKKISLDNNLSHLFPEIARQWSSENATDASSVTYGSGEKALWECEHGHKWVSRIVDRTMKSQGCPHCHPQESKAEIEIREFVRSLFPDTRKIRGILTNRRFELDIYVPSLRKAIEYDGGYFHNRPEVIARDTIKNSQCQDAGIELLRIKEEEYVVDKDTSLDRIRRWLTGQLDTLEP